MAKFIEDTISLPANYIASGYEAMFFSTDKKDLDYAIVASKKINRFLVRNQPILCEHAQSNVYDIPATPELLDYIGKHKCYNGQILGLESDLLIGSLENGKNIEVAKRSYYDALATNNLAQVLDADPFSMLESNSMPGYENGQLIPMSENGLADMIGSSTVALTSDGHILLNRQGNLSVSNTGRLAPSGSGSVDYSDFITIAETVGNIRRAPLSTVITKAAERELTEESCVPAASIESTVLIGFFRLLGRGGQPDFVSITHLSCSKQAIENNYASGSHIQEIGFSEKPIFIAASKSTLGLSLVEALRAYPVQTVSIQLLATAHFAIQLGI